MGGIDMEPFSVEEYRKNRSRKVVTRDGRNAEIICIYDDFDTLTIGLVIRRTICIGYSTRVIAMIEDKHTNTKHSYTYPANGSFLGCLSCPTDRDLFFAD